MFNSTLRFLKVVYKTFRKVITKQFRQGNLFSFIWRMVFQEVLFYFQ